MKYDLILIRYGEMMLKKSNYRQFLKAISADIEARLKDLPGLCFSANNSRFYVDLNGEDEKEAIRRLLMIPGIYSLSPCLRAGRDYDDIAAKAVILIENVRKGSEMTFKVETNRADKSFRATSITISRETANRILPAVPGLKADVHHPEITLHIDFRKEGTYLYTEEIKGMGGYPAGTQGKALLMLSGGIDSPVAGFLALRKGIELTAVHFFSPPYTSLNSLQKAVDLLRKLAVFSETGKIELIIVPFTEIQDRIMEKAKREYLVTLMRRAMYRIADGLCGKRKIKAIVNGESIGQVASQTLESMYAINEVTKIPVIRPLATLDKEEIIAKARETGTYDISVRPYEDCCTVFVPKHPVIKPQPEAVKREEEKCELDSLVEKAISSVKTMIIDYREEQSVISNTSEIEI